MKWSVAWADVIAQNMTLKMVIGALVLCTVGLGVVSAKLSLKKPLMIERPPSNASCFSKTVEALPSSERTTQETEAFVRQTTEERFDLKINASPDYFSSEEMAARTQEQKEFAQRGMTQRVLVNSVKIDGNQALLDTDRLISVGQIRSAFPFPLQVTLSTLPRSESNPYGLRIEKISPVKKEEPGK